jgi:hypothetical protein
VAPEEGQARCTQGRWNRIPACAARLEERGRADVFTSVSAHIVCGEAGDARSGCACVLVLKTCGASGHCHLGLVLADPSSLTGTC